jgi:hydrogenase expression/formation protein HypD
VKVLDEYRDRRVAESLLVRIRATSSRPWTLMEVCGGQTHTIVRYGLDRLLEGAVELLHGPSCPVALETIDRAHAIAVQPEVIFASYGDVLRVPGTRGDLLGLRAAGADIRVVYSALDAVQLALDHPERQVVFLGIGFETTAPANAMAIYQAAARRVKNFSVLVSHVLAPVAIEATLREPGRRVHGFLGPGYVCGLFGTRDYDLLAARYRVPIVVTGFEPADLLEGVLMALEQLEAGRYHLANQYERTIQRDGRQAAVALIDRVFELEARDWREVGTPMASSWRIRDEFAEHDAAQRFAACFDYRPHAPALRVVGGSHAG